MIDSLNNKNIKSLETSDGDGDGKDSFPVILIVDDDDDSRLMLKLLLEMWKYRVIEANDGIEAISITKTMCPNLILMDVRLPNLNGFDVTHQIRQSAEIEKLPIVFLSASADAPSKQKGFDVGGNEYLTKPLDFEALENTLGKYLRRTQEISI